MKSLTLSTKVSDLFMVGPTYAQRLKKLGIKTVEEFLHHYPFRYQDLSLISKIGECQPGETVTLHVTTISLKNIYTKTGKKIQKGIVADETGQLEVTWFNQPYLAQTLKPGIKIALAGKVDIFGFKKTMTSPEYETLKSSKEGVARVGGPPSSARSVARTSDGGKRATGPRVKTTVHTGRLVPIYPETAGVSSKWLRSRIAPLVRKLAFRIPDWLPRNVQKKFALCPLPSALTNIHFPNNKKMAEAAKRRLAFDELLLLHLKTLSRKREWQVYKAAHLLKFNQKKIEKFIKGLPFKLTRAQTKTVQEILRDLKRNRPMNRLLEGDVGSGKTVVAALAAYATFLAGFKSALMAPTEILAVQHYKSLKKLFGKKLKIGLFTSSHKEKRSAKTFDLVLGTHALLYQKLDFKNLGLIVIDEQHRFGVEQRANLIKKGRAPHILTMTATPIPRTVALTLYADLDLSILDEMPKGRKPVKTWVVPEKKRADAYSWIRQKIRRGHQIFLICPLIEPSESERMTNVKAATQEFEKLSQDVFPDLKLLLLHGKVKAKKKNEIIEKFKKKKADILVSTPVVEVGIDITNATIIVIEAAERFGLAQLHQLRGRVGRGNKQSFCLLFTGQPKLTRRLKAMETNHSGIKLAEFDLKLRGPGEIYGTAQSGFLDLKIASFYDKELIYKTKKAAEELFEQLSDFPLLKEKLEKTIIKDVKPN